MTANVTVYRKVSLCEILLSAILSAILIMKTIWGFPATAALENPKLFFLKFSLRLNFKKNFLKRALLRFERFRYETV